jgi:hypothetical protein
MDIPVNFNCKELLEHFDANEVEYLIYPVGPSSEEESMHWRRVGVCGAVTVDRFWHAGLSEDGKRCFVADFDENCFVWDVDAARIVWEDNGSDGDSPYPLLKDWQEAGFITIADPTAAGRYRLIGLHHNNPRPEGEATGTRLELHVAEGLLALCSLRTGQEIQRVTFEADSGDWAFATFSDDGSTIAVLEPYNVTFFRDR